MALEADTILPVQLERGSRFRGPPGEKLLMIAILEDALDTARKRRDVDGNRAEARRWVMDDDLTWLYSFLSICDVTGINGAALRERMLKTNWTVTGTLRSVTRGPRHQVTSGRFKAKHASPYNTP